MKELIWLRNYVIAPISEEFTFRACMLALIIHCTNPLVAVFICPIFFGAAHLHHMIEQMRFGVKWNVALATSCKKLILKMTSNGSFKLMNCVWFLSVFRFPIHVHIYIRCLLCVSVSKNRLDRCVYVALSTYKNLVI
jgi:hypothetical protein